MYDQGTLSLMTRGLPATRHVARTLDTWQLPRQVTTEARHVADDTWQTSGSRCWTTRGRRRRARRTSPHVSTASRRRVVRPPVLLLLHPLPPLPTQGGRHSLTPLPLPLSMLGELHRATGAWTPPPRSRPRVGRSSF